MTGRFFTSLLMQLLLGSQTKRYASERRVNELNRYYRKGI